MEEAISDASRYVVTENASEEHNSTPLRPTSESSKLTKNMNDIQIASIIRTGLLNLIEDANKETGSMIDRVESLGDGKLMVTTLHGDKFTVTVTSSN